MENNILNYYGTIHTGYLHARGKIATGNSIALLELKPGETILEIGFGTGVTLVQIASENKALNCFGLDVSEVMFKKATERISLCGLSNRIKLSLLKEKNKFPFPDNTFDKVYAESVIGIQEGDDFEKLFREIKRVLKPEGFFVINETMWRESTDVKTAQEINIRNKERYGIVQANHDYAHLHDWKKLLNDIGFHLISAINVADIQPVKRKQFSTSLLLSRCYSLAGKLKVNLLPSLRKERIKFRMAMIETSGTKDLLESFIIKAYNKK